ncbi:MAG: alpha/beta hydrolase fold domain-containing protein [Burkholderiaceae bacterium]
MDRLTSPDPQSIGAPWLAAHPHPQAAALLAQLAQARAGQPHRYEMPFAQARVQLLLEREPWLDDGPVCELQDRMIRRGYRTFNAQIALPEVCDARRIVVYFHGGGWCVGSPRSHEAIVRRLAVAMACPVWSIDYALAPEHPFPQGLDDCLSAIDTVATQYPAARIVLAGDSAGANLALAAAMWLRDRRHRDKRAIPVLPAALLLFYGVYSDQVSGASMEAFADGRFGLSLQAHVRYLQAYAAPGASSDSQAAAPARCHAFALTPEASLADLPPAFLLAAELDILRDQSVALALALDAAGTPTSLLEMHGVFHGFLAYGKALPDVDRAIKSAADFANRNVALTISP